MLKVPVSHIKLFKAGGVHVHIYNFMYYHLYMIVHEITPLDNFSVFKISMTKELTFF